MSKLREMIDDVRTTEEVIVEIWLGEEETKHTRNRINKELRFKGNEDKKNILKDLLETWKKSGYDGDSKRQMLTLFGEKNEVLFGNRLLFTLSGDGKQFRAWFGIPGRMCYTHVDSMGKGILFHVYGEPKEVLGFVSALVPDAKDKVALWNGTTLYGLELSNINMPGRK